VRLRPGSHLPVDSRRGNRALGAYPANHLEVGHPEDPNHLGVVAVPNRPAERRPEDPNRPGVRRPEDPNRPGGHEDRLEERRPVVLHLVERPVVGHQVDRPAAPIPEVGHPEARLADPIPAERRPAVPIRLAERHPEARPEDPNRPAERHPAARHHPAVPIPLAARHPAAPNLPGAHHHQAALHPPEAARIRVHDRSQSFEHPPWSALRQFPDESEP
jgi:hypothetical protein